MSECVFVCQRGIREVNTIHSILSQTTKKDLNDCYKVCIQYTEESQTILKAGVMSVLAQLGPLNILRGQGKTIHAKTLLYHFIVL